MDYKMFERETRQMNLWEMREFKDVITPFGNWVFMERNVEGWKTTSLNTISLCPFEFLLNSTT